MIREPFVAGTFYAGSRQALERQVDECFLHPEGPGVCPAKTPGRTVAMVLPHAGLMYSGPVAAHGYAQLKQEAPYEAAVLLGPDHRARGNGFSLYAEGAFRTPLGDVPIAEELAQIIGSLPGVHIDPGAHEHEHSLEVHLPFLQTIYDPPPAIVPLIFYPQKKQDCVTLGEGLAGALAGRNVLVIASSDCSHYVPMHEARHRDLKALDYVLRLNEDGFHDHITLGDVGFCGYGPITAAIAYAKRRGASEATLMKYLTSGEMGGGTREVVGYAAVRLATK